VTSTKHLVAVRPTDTAKGVKVAEIYRFEKSAPHLPTPIVVGDLLFSISEQGIATCLDVKTGEQIWQKRIGGNFSGSPVCVDAKLYAVDENGTVVVIAAGREYEELARNELGQLSRSTPAVAGGRMYVRTLSKLFCIGGKQ
jgi:outer membrane protein assembly factor BamB